MRIFVIGNGFDLQHGLKTNYKDFLDYCKAIKSGGNANNRGANKLAKELKETNPEMYKDFVKLSDCFWIRYIESVRSNIGDKWIDFETTIEKVVKDIWKDREANGIEDSLSIETCRKYIAKENIITYAEFFEYLSEELQKLKHALEIYLDYHVNHHIHEDKRMALFMNLVAPDKLLSFNYTETFSILYGGILDYDYIHGIANMNHRIEDCNLVLGFDDHYLNNNAVLELVPFEKYYQRIINGTGAKYTEWLREKDEHGQIIEREVFFYGHSMSPADGDILKAIIKSPNTKCHILYRKGHNEDRAEMVKNLAVVLGPEELIKRTGNGTATIFFMEVAV